LSNDRIFFHFQENDYLCGPQEVVLFLTLKQRQLLKSIGFLVQWGFAGYPLITIDKGQTVKLSNTF